MRRTLIPILAAAAGLLALGPALAADMTGEEIKGYLSGKTIYIQLTGASASGAAGQGIIYYAREGSALYKVPSGATWHGTWTTKGNTLCVDWKERPNNACVKYVKDGSTVTIVDGTSGQLRGTIVKVADGNAEKIGP